MERKVGEIFTYSGKIYQVVKSIVCTHCAFRGKLCGEPSAGNCMPSSRSDKTSVIFKEIKDMENNQLTIDIPEGMEIDLENSDLAKGIVRFKQSIITYKDVEDTLKYKSIMVNKNNIPKLVTLSKLMNIAKYYNGDWKPDWNNSDKPKYFIRYSTGTYTVDCNYTYNYGNIFFKNKKDAQAVIENPNFRDILDKIYKN